MLAALDPPVQLVVPEPSHWANLWGGSDYMGALMADPAAAPYVSIVAMHQYDGPDPPSYPLPTPRRGTMNFPNPGLTRATNSSIW